MVMQPNNPEAILAKRTHEKAASVWSQPPTFKLSNTEDQLKLETLIDNRESADLPPLQCHDPLDIVTRELFEHNHPEHRGDRDKLLEFQAEALNQGVEFGTWVVFPWSGILSRFPDREDYRQLRTSRNRNLITDEEQAVLFDARIAVLGLSVGSKAVEALVESGIGGEYVLADNDQIEATNLNRLSAGYTDLGNHKADNAAIGISEKDPWIDITLLRDGLTVETAREISDCDLIVEEMDNLPAKALARITARDHQVPLVMAADIGKKSVVDIERYDTEDATKIIFNGKIDENQAALLASGEVSHAENMRLMARHTGLKHLTKRLMDTVTLIGTKVNGIPQLGMTATRGGTNIAYAAEDILLGRELPSGRYVDSPRSVYRQSREHSLVETVKSAINLKKHLSQ
jgi:hypothetical protein